MPVADAEDPPMSPRGGEVGFVIGEPIEEAL
jgi:hypothetical protein